MQLMWCEHMTAQAIGPWLVHITPQATEAQAQPRCRDVMDSHQRFPPVGTLQDDAIKTVSAQHLHGGIRMQSQMNSPFSKRPLQHRKQRRYIRIRIRQASLQGLGRELGPIEIPSMTRPTKAS
jgi:hypothetical protein